MEHDNSVSYYDYDMGGPVVLTNRATAFLCNVADYTLHSRYELCFTSLHLFSLYLRCSLIHLVIVSVVVMAAAAAAAVDSEK